VNAIGEVLIDGAAVSADEAAVSVFDIGFQRGYGCFEAMRSYRGSIFRLDQHVARLQQSGKRMGLPVPDTAVVAGWAKDRAHAGGDCTVRVLITGGTRLLQPGTGSVTIVYAEPLHVPTDRLRLQPREAPWHAAGAASELTGAKTLSYGPNLAVSLAARHEGYGDAVLLARDGTVLEGPTYSVAWLVGDTLETPSLDLGILDSITRGAVLELAPSLGLEVAEGRYDLARVLAADEVVAMSTLKEVVSVAAIGDREWESTRWASKLRAAFRDLVAAEAESG
jgi:branched-subunit amino acid aminotransferase/4-amino-4-deoxychorismate lyase